MKLSIMKPEIVKPKAGQESVWDYPRPPRLERTNKHVEVIFNGELVADSVRAWRVLETSHPPVYYIPLEDIKDNYLQASSMVSYCEWKGQAAYFDLVSGHRRMVNAAWTYKRPSAPFQPIQDHVAFYAWAVDECRVDGERVIPQPGHFYGGWITADIVGPFKGEPGTRGW